MTLADPAAPRVRLPREERRAQLLTAARQVFVAEGYHSASMDDIATAAGVSKPVLYQHFPGKRELYLALLEDGAEGLVNTVRQGLTSTTENKQRVPATIGAFFDFIDDQDGAFRLVFESDFTNEPVVRERVDAALTECAEMISQAFAEDAGLGDEEAHLLAVAVTGMAQVSARYWLGREERLPRDTAVALISNLAWRGIRGFPQQP